MTTGRASRSRENFRARVHDMLRTAILDAARERAERLDWADVRISDIAEDVGVSRQTVHNEFGAKEALGLALFEREMKHFEEGILRNLREAEDFRSAVRGSLSWTLVEARRHRILQRILRSARSGDGSLLPMLTVRAHVIVLPLREAIADAYCERWPGVGRAHVVKVTDLVIRFGLSQVILPSDLPEDELLDLAVEMISRAAGAAPSPT